MKAIFSCLFFLLCTLGLFARSGQTFTAQHGDYGLYVWHLTQPGETMFQLARDYHVRASLLLKVNDWGADSRLKSGQKVRIPLTETNFFKLAALHEGSGYCPVYHNLGAGESLAAVRQRYGLSAATFQSWNGTEADLEGKKALIVGWLKYKPRTRTGEDFIEKENKDLQKDLAEIPPFEEQAPPTQESAPVARFSEESSRALNPRFVDTAEARKSSPAVQTVKREAKAIGNDTRDAWQKLTGKTANASRKDASDQPPSSFVSRDTFSNVIEPAASEPAPPPAVKAQAPRVSRAEARAAEPRLLPKDPNRTADPDRAPWFSRFKEKVRNTFSPPKDNVPPPVPVRKPEPAPVPKEEEKTLGDAAPAPAPDPVVRNEMRALNFSQTRSGKAAYFFGGPSGGKFYVATNLAPRGTVIKVTNPENGKSVICEVMAPLSASDAAKGLLLKLSDNARLPLGQRNNQFAVRVNY